MSENLGDFLVDLATDPDLAGRFSDNPQAELARRGLTPDDQAAVLTRDSRRLGSALGASPQNSSGGTKTIKKSPKRSTPKKGPRKPSGSKKTKR